MNLYSFKDYIVIREALNAFNLQSPEPEQSFGIFSPDPNIYSPKPAKRRRNPLKLKPYGFKEPLPPTPNASFRLGLPEDNPQELYDFGMNLAKIRYWEKQHQRPWVEMLLLALKGSSPSYYDLSPQVLWSKLVNGEFWGTQALDQALKVLSHDFGTLKQSELKKVIKEFQKDPEKKIGSPQKYNPIDSRTSVPTNLPSDYGRITDNMFFNLIPSLKEKEPTDYQWPTIQKSSR